MRTRARAGAPARARARAAARARESLEARGGGAPVGRVELCRQMSSRAHEVVLCSSAAGESRAVAAEP